MVKCLVMYATFSRLLRAFSHESCMTACNAEFNQYVTRRRSAVRIGEWHTACGRRRWGCRRLSSVAINAAGPRTILLEYH
eukprot:4936738-Amphidinium_carterae.1